MLWILWEQNNKADAVGIRFVTNHELRELARILKVTVPWLLGME